VIGHRHPKVEAPPPRWLRILMWSVMIVATPFVEVDLSRLLDWLQLSH
jgi:hypothetical protein